MGNIQAPAPREAFISAMRHVASSVTVVTTDGVAGRFGATVSAFSSVSADPPSILVCLRKDSRIATAVRRNEKFCVNILPEDAVSLARRFAGEEDGNVGDRFDQVSTHRMNPNDPPMLQGANALTCELVSRLDHGTHEILVGSVRHIQALPINPLTYLDGAFHAGEPRSGS